MEPISPQVRLNPRQSWILDSLSVELGFRILISVNMKHFCACVCVWGGGGCGGGGGSGKWEGEVRSDLLSLSLKPKEGLILEACLYGLSQPG